MEFFCSLDEFRFGLQCFETIQFNTRQIVTELFHHSIDTAQNFDIRSTAIEIIEHRNDRVIIERIHAHDAAEQRLNEMVRENFLAKRRAE